MYKKIPYSFSISISTLLLPILICTNVMIPVEMMGGVSFESSVLEDCNMALSLDCEDVAESHIYDETVATVLDDVCFEGFSLDSEAIRDLWFQFNVSNDDGYYLEALNCNVGINVYQGTCGSLELVDCVQSFDETSAYWEAIGLSEGNYFIQVLNEEESLNEETEINFGCFEVHNSDCSVIMDFLNVPSCLNDDGTINLTAGGTTNRSFVSLEIMVDGLLYFIDCGVNNGLWISNFVVQGESLDYVKPYAGNSETGCSGEVMYNVPLPELYCNAPDPNRLKFIDAQSPFCSPASAEVKMYQAGTTELKHVFTVNYNEALDAYLIHNPPIGLYDVFIKPMGCLQQGYGEVDINIGINTIQLEALQKGDLNNTNSINIADISIISGAFNSVIGAVNYNASADFNCSESINITDISIFGGNFNLMGDNPPILEP